MSSTTKRTTSSKVKAALSKGSLTAASGSKRFNITTKSFYSIVSRLGASSSVGKGGVKSYTLQGYGA